MSNQEQTGNGCNLRDYDDTLCGVGVRRKMSKMGLDDIIPLALFVFFIIFAIAVIIIDYTGSYEYETIDGEKGTAVHCNIPYRGVPYCLLDDGTKVYGIKKYKRLAEEEE